MLGNKKMSREREASGNEKNTYYTPLPNYPCCLIIPN